MQARAAEQGSPALAPLPPAPLALRGGMVSLAHQVWKLLLTGSGAAACCAAAGPRPRIVSLPPHPTSLAPRLACAIPMEGLLALLMDLRFLLGAVLGWKVLAEVRPLPARGSASWAASALGAAFGLPTCPLLPCLGPRMAGGEDCGLPGRVEQLQWGSCSPKATPKGARQPAFSA